jgi:hypothetical protein
LPLTFIRCCTVLVFILFYCRIFSCKRCGPGFVASSAEDIVNALAVAVNDKDFEDALTEKCAASTSCPAFATISKIKIAFSPSYGAVAQSSSSVELEQAKTHFRKSFKTMLKFESGSALGLGAPTDEACFAVFDEVFVPAYNGVHAGEDTQAETCFVTSATPDFVVSSLRVTTQGGKYYYNSSGGTCRSIAACLPFIVLQLIVCVHHAHTPYLVSSS